MLRLIPLFALLLAGCIPNILRPDDSKQPSDKLINQMRLEFIGDCGHELGTIACYPGKETKVVTEFPGKITMSSSGAGCALRKDIAATVPETLIPTPTRPDGKICPVIVLYLPDYPIGRKQWATRDIVGEVSYLPDDRYKYSGSIALSRLEVVSLLYPLAVRGAYVSRQLEKPVSYIGQDLIFQPVSTGTDLLQVKLWMQDGTNQYKVYTANYYGPGATNLTYTFKDRLLTLPKEVSIVTMTSRSPSRRLKVHVPKSFTGYVRGYTVIGRTLVLKFEKGEIVWIR